MYSIKGADLIGSATYPSLPMAVTAYYPQLVRVMPSGLSGIPCLRGKMGTVFPVLPYRAQCDFPFMGTFAAYAPCSFRFRNRARMDQVAGALGLGKDSFTMKIEEGAEPMWILDRNKSFHTAQACWVLAHSAPNFADVEPMPYLEPGTDFDFGSEDQWSPLLQAWATFNMKMIGIVNKTKPTGLRARLLEYWKEMSEATPTALSYVEGVVWADGDFPYVPAKNDQGYITVIPGFVSCTKDGNSPIGYAMNHGWNFPLFGSVRPCLSKALFAGGHRMNGGLLLTTEYLSPQCIQAMNVVCTPEAFVMSPPVYRNNRSEGSGLGYLRDIPYSDYIDWDRVEQANNGASHMDSQELVQFLQEACFLPTATVYGGYGSPMTFVYTGDPTCTQVMNNFFVFDEDRYEVLANVYGTTSEIRLFVQASGMGLTPRKDLGPIADQNLLQTETTEVLRSVRNKAVADVSSEKLHKANEALIPRGMFLGSVGLKPTRLPEGASFLSVLGRVTAAASKATIDEILNDANEPMEDEDEGDPEDMDEDEEGADAEDEEAEEIEDAEEDNGNPPEVQPIW